jgi:SDR family mycofactocin-dependent oxidoreductase
MGRMDGKVVLITGVGRGQGRSHAVTLAREGADIVGIDCPAPTGAIPYELANAEDLRETAAQIEALDRRAVFTEGDVRSQADLDRAVERGLETFGHIDVCVANAGVTAISPLWETSEDEWNAVLDTNVGGVWRTVKAVAPHMIEREGGSIILISSVLGVEGAQGLSAYAASKHGVLGLMKSICQELGPLYGVRCNSILPSMVDTDIIHWPGMYDYAAGGEGLGKDFDISEACKVWHAIKGVGAMRTQETSNAVLYLASDESACISGLELLVDAGHRVLPGFNYEAIAARAAVQ